MPTKLHRKLTNCEKIAHHMADNPNHGITIQKVPGTAYWLIYQTINGTTVTITLAHPERTVARTVSEGITIEEAMDLWENILRLELSTRIKRLQNRQG